MVAHLSRRSRLALDTESDSFFAYFPKVCLIQITTFADAHNPDPGDVVDFLVDPLSLESLEPLGALLASGEQEVVMHAAENDILMLRRGFGFRFPSVFDTQLAARILGHSRVGLGAMLESLFGVVSDKRMQRTDWSARPLSAQQVAYAQTDAHYLLALRELLKTELRMAGRVEEADDAFATLVAHNGVDKAQATRTFWQMKATHRTAPTDLGVLEALWEWREQEAQRQDRPPFKIVSDDVLVEAAQLRPDSLHALSLIAGLSQQQRVRYGAALIEATRLGGVRPPPAFPRPVQRPEQMLSLAEHECFERLRKWRTETAQARGVAPEIVFNNETLLEIAQRQPQSIEALSAVPGVSRWKARTYGEAVLVLANGDGDR